jgi:hypothetical protein
MWLRELLNNALADNLILVDEIDMVLKFNTKIRFNEKNGQSRNDSDNVEEIKCRD